MHVGASKKISGNSVKLSVAGSTVFGNISTGPGPGAQKVVYALIQQLIVRIIELDEGKALTLSDLQKKL